MDYSLVNYSTRRGLYDPPQLAVFKPAPIHLFKGSASNAANASSYTFDNGGAGLDFHAEAKDRFIVAGIHGRDDNSGSPNVTSATIGGVAATIDKSDNTNAREMYALISAHVPEDASVNSIAFNTNVTIERAAISWWVIYNLESFVRRAVPQSSFADPASGTFSNALKYAVLIAICSTTTGASYTWTGLNEKYDFAVETLRVTGADLQATGDGNVSVTCDTDTSARWYGVWFR